MKPSNMAYLWDRVKVNKGEPQRYGTQGACKGKGQWEPNPIEDPKGLDANRKAVGLPPFSDYRKLVTPSCL